MLLGTVACTSANAGVSRAELNARLYRGRALFLGEAPLQGMPRAHSDFLPPAVVRCANCHSTGKLKLNAATLVEPRVRRGGPPSAYTELDFCKLLETGIDPAAVLIDHAMPVYQVSHRDCASLWAYITHSEEKHHAR